MQQKTWTAVDNFLESLHAEDEILTKIRAENVVACLPDISVSEEQGRFLTVLARSVKARMILEIGTLGGYSAVCLARALPVDGRLITLEANEAHARVARANVALAGLADQVDVVVGSALEILPKILSECPSGFDFIFIDADKETYPEYWSWALRLAHAGTLIVADNVVRKGAVADAENRDALVEGVREYLKLAAAEPLVLASTLQTVGSKGHDGFFDLLRPLGVGAKGMTLIATTITHSTIHDDQETAGVRSLSGTRGCVCSRDRYETPQHVLRSAGDVVPVA